MTHDYKRHGTTTLFAALDVLTGKVIGECLPRHRTTEFLRFVRRINNEVPKDLAVHLILDNYGTHEHPSVEAWLAKHPSSGSVAPSRSTSSPPRWVQSRRRSCGGLARIWDSQALTVLVSVSTSGWSMGA